MSVAVRKGSFGLVLLSFAVDEVAIQSELAKDGVHLTKPELRAAFEPATNESVRVFGKADFQCRAAQASLVIAAPCLRAKPSKPWMRRMASTLSRR